MTNKAKDEALVLDPVHNRALQARELLVIALQNNAAIDIIERLAALQKEQLALLAETDFNDALNRVQAEIDAVKPDLRNSQTGSKYASYAALDREVRPLYTKEGFSLSFDQTDSPKPDHIRVLAYLRRSSHKEVFKIDIAVNTKGIKGNENMTITHAEGSANSYGKRYLLGNIFNIPVGEVLEPDDDGNAAAKGNAEGALVETIVKAWKERIVMAPNAEQFKLRFVEVWQVATAAGLSKAQLEELAQVKEETKKKFSGSGNGNGNGVHDARPGN